METRAHHVVIGAFVFLVLAAAIVFGLWLSKNHSRDSEARYDVVFNEAVNGLSTGGAVMYSGIRVGTIERLRLDPADPRRVVARILIDSAVPIKQDTTAQLRLAGVTGTAVVQLSGGSPNSPLLRAKDDDEVPVILATQSSISQLLAGGGDLMDGVNDVLGHTRQALSAENVEKLGQILGNLEKTTAAIAAQRDDFARLMKNLTEASRQATETMARASTLAEHTDQVVDGPGREAMRNAQQALASLAHASDAINALVQENRGAVASGVQSLSALGGTLNETQAVLASLRGVLRHIDDNPAGYLLGRGQTQEFTP